MADVHQIGGTPALMKYMLANGLLHGDELTITGRTLKENLADAPDFPAGQDVVRPVSDPILPYGHIAVLKGSLAPEVRALFAVVIFSDSLFIFCGYCIGCRGEDHRQGGHALRRAGARL